MMTVRQTLIASAMLVLALACGTPTEADPEGRTEAPAVETVAGHADQGTRPHIIYILADDLGNKDVGVHGSDIRTPHLDRLAETGARLEQFHTQPMCTPTRAALLTGRYPYRYGLQTFVIPSSGTYGLDTTEQLLPQVLKEAGYATAIVGKWHLGHADPAYWPMQRGFDSHYGPLIGELDYFTHEQHGVVDWYDNNERKEEEGYTTELLGRRAVELIDGHDPATPLFLYLTFNAPHTPYQAPQAYLDQYAHIADADRRAYAGSITAMDDQIGAVVDALERRGMRDNTLIVFHSDNGGTFNAMFAGEGDMSEREIPCDNSPYRDGKGSFYEGGTRVCGLVNWPGHVKEGITVDGLVHVVDLFPTLSALAGAEAAGTNPLDGTNVWSTLSTNAPSPRTEMVYNIDPFRAAIRMGDWKLIWRTLLPATAELYHIPQDPSEANDLAAEHPDRVADMQARINALSKDAAKSLWLATQFQAIQPGLHAPPVMPTEAAFYYADEP